MKHILPIFLLLCSCMLTPLTAVYAATKTIYIKPFAMLEGFKKTDPAGNLVKDYMSEYIIENARNKFSIISDDEVKQVLAHEALRMNLDACYDDACMKSLMKSIKTDYMIYGSMSLIEGNFIVTVKMLVRTEGAVRISRVKTLEFKDRSKLQMASNTLAAYVISDKNLDMESSSDKEIIKMKTPKPVIASVPYGLSASYRFFMPLSSPTKKYFKYFHGCGLDYTAALSKYIAIFGGSDFIYSTGKTEYQWTVSILGLWGKTPAKIISFFNSYYFGGRFGYPVGTFFYPYISISLKGMWHHYLYKSKPKNYAGVGADGAAGFAFNIKELISLFAEFRYGWAMLIDKNKTNVSGMGVAGGLMMHF